MKKKKDESNRPEQGQYDAFISYKHSEFDSEICLTLHKQLESFKIKRGKETRKVKRVFLDTEELASVGSLSKSIQEALDNSRHLIVICSKDTPQSPWVKKEIEYFVSKHGYDKVLALLIDGEPAEAFPEPLRYANIDGVLKEVEPLAADIRAENPKQSKKALKREILRLLAPLLGMTYDELRQRHQKMVIRRIIRTASLVASMFLCFGIYALMQWQYTEEQNRVISDANERIAENNVLIASQNEELIENNRIITEKSNSVLAMQSRYMAKEALNLLEYGNRRLSVLLARAALPGSPDNPDRPLVDEAVFALSEALGLYNFPSGYFYFDAVFTHDSKVQSFTYDSEAVFLDDNRVVTRSRLGDAPTVDLWKYTYSSEYTPELELLSSFSIDIRRSFTVDVSREKVYCITNEDGLVIIDIDGDELVAESVVEAKSYDTVYITQDGIPVLLGTQHAVINPGQDDSKTLDLPIYSADKIFMRQGRYIVASRDKIAVVNGDGSASEEEPVILEITAVYAVSPIADEFVYYKDGRLYFKDFFTEHERIIDITDFGRVASLFYSPDGKWLFVATEALRLYAYDINSELFTEMEAEFRQIPVQAIYINDILAITSVSKRATFFNPETMKVIGQTSWVYGYSDDMLLVSNGNSAGIVPVYTLEQMLELADDVIAQYVFDEREVAKYILQDGG